MRYMDVNLYLTTGPDPEMLLPGGTESRSLEPSGGGREVSPREGGWEYERWDEPPLIRGVRGIAP